jgi:hypothetical protein
LGSVLPHLKYILNVTPPRIIGAVVVPLANDVANSLLVAMLRVVSSVGRGKGIVNTATTREEAIQICEERLRTYNQQEG